MYLCPMQATHKAYLELHLAVLLFGFTAILGDLISVSALSLVWWRVLITSLSLMLLLKGLGFLQNFSREEKWRFAGIGILVALHWLTFYGAIKIGNASVALVGLATTAFMTALLEPLLLRTRFSRLELMLGIVIVPAMGLIVRDLEGDMLLGLAVALVSAFFATLFSILNKKWMGMHSPMQITFLELGSAWAFLSLLLPFYGRGQGDFFPQDADWLYLLALSLLCTTLAYVLALRSLRVLSAFASNLTINLEPVYGILLAMWILGEQRELSRYFYAGVAVLVVSVLGYGFLKGKHKQGD